MKDGATATLDSSGRIVIPKAVRERAGLVPGAPLSVAVVDGRVEIEVAPSPVRAVRRGRLLVAEPGSERDSLTNEDVRGATETVRQRGATG